MIQVIMETKLQRCPKCGGEMEQGFVMDFGDKYLRKVSSWAKGSPRLNWIDNTKVPEEGLIPIGAFRCSSCGFLEYYAREEFGAQ